MHPLAKCTSQYKVAQYLFINIPGISLLEWHPYSVSSGPDEGFIEIHVKGLGKHTQELVNRAKNHRRLWVRVDGPYGNTNRITHRRYPVLVLVGGGIGVTPIMSFVNDLYRSNNVIKSKVQHCVEKVCLLWTIPSEDHYGWFRKQFEECLSAHAVDASFPKFELSVYVTRAKECVNPDLKPGRPSILGFVDRALEDPTKAAYVFTCGPSSLVNEVWDVSNAAKRRGNRVHFHHEVFEF
jgi:NAD(P)H-flavin reductase